MKVLYVNHTSEVSGGERSLLDLLSGLPEDVEPRLATPDGQLSREALRRGIPLVRINGTAGSLRLHPLHTPRTVGELARAAYGVRRFERIDHPDIVHANSIRAGVIVNLARTAAPAVVHVRDCLPPGRLSQTSLRFISSGTTTVVANSEYTARSVRAAAPGARIEVIHNPVDLSRWDPAAVDRVHARARMPGLRSRSLLLGVVAQLTPWKGQDTAIEALHLLRRRGVDAHLLLIGSAKFVAGSTRFDNQAYVEELEAQVERLRLQDRVSFLGEREDVVELVSALDALLLPSHEEPFGRAAIEAMALGVPVVATNVGGPPEIIEDGRDGLLVDPRQPEAWADAVQTIAEAPDLAKRLGRNGRARVEQDFSLERHVGAVLDVYRKALG